MLNLEKIRKHLLFAGLLLTVFVKVVPIGEGAQFYFLIISIILTGIPHGSLDFFIQKQSLINTNQKVSLYLFLTKYLFSMLVFGLVWWLFPTLALFIFIVMSAYHFGEVDWPRRGSAKLDSVLYTIYGFLMIAFILTSHINSAAPILEIIVQGKLTVGFWLKWGSLLYPYCGVLLGLNIFVLFLLREYLRWEKAVLYQFVLQSILLIFIIHELPLYLCFGFYFGLWHSVISFNLIRRQMNLTNDWLGWLSIARKAIPFTVLAWLGILVLIVVSGMFQTEWLVLSNIFLGIAILTLPHLQVFTKINLG
ncbi:MAG: Brp/Blh family beta-carotene 15,15'-dioxygenase [Cyclobacteriaceae bacterium]|nr:Brp/Blh family beta-carotene 15,15'-dioxygenase [Cyclobacteriaceae bacterium]